MNASESEISPEEAMNAVRSRNASYDGRFFFAVVTTGIYCRPSCSARQPKSENVRLFDSTGDAEAAGYRACKRCKPDVLSSKYQRVIEVARYIEQHADENLSLAMLAAEFDLSPTVLQKSFKAAIGISPKAFQQGVRQERFKSLLKRGQSVTDAVFEAGYGSVSRVYERSGEQLGMSPKTYREGATQETISYYCSATSVGELMIGATDKGVCFSMFGSDEALLKQALQQEFPKAELVAAKTNSQLELWYQAIDKHLKGSGPLPDIPLDVRGTAFQIKVWTFLKSIAVGDTVSYTDVACGIDQPSAARSAATACGKNRIALLIPCHRVLRGDGSMGGFRWGIERKRRLLAIEKGVGGG